MINVNELGPGIAIYFGKGLKFHLAETTIYGFILATVLAVLGIWMGRNLEKIPKGKQVLAEALVSGPPHKNCSDSGHCRVQGIVIRGGHGETVAQAGSAACRNRQLPEEAVFFGVHPGRGFVFVADRDLLVHDQWIRPLDPYGHRFGVAIREGVGI